MPRAPSFKTASIRDLFRQLRYAPEETLERLIERAEELLYEIEPHRAYPEDFIAFRITNYRPEANRDPLMLVGEAVIADLATFVQQISRQLHLPQHSETRGSAHRIDQLAIELGVSPRTLRRYHKRGLMFHYIEDDSDADTPEQHLACYERSLARFRERYPGLIDRAATFSRVEQSKESDIIDEALALRNSQSLSRQTIAERLAAQHGRAVETVRAILERYENRTGTRVFRVRRRTSTRERALIERAWRMGCDAQAIAIHLERSEQAVTRAVRAFRVSRIRSCSISWIELPTFTLPDADEVILSPPGVASDLATPEPQIELIEWLEHRRADASMPDDRGVTLLAAYHFLKRRASFLVRDAGRDVPERDVDRAETDLRWAALLKRALARSAVRIAITRIEQNLARPIVQLPSEEIRSLIRVAIDQIGLVIETANPSQRRTLARLVPLALDRHFARGPLARSVAPRATVRHQPGSLFAEDPFASLCPWQSFLDLSTGQARALGLLEDSAARELINARFGRTEQPPMTLDELARAYNRSSRAIDRALRRAMTLLRSIG